MKTLLSFGEALIDLLQDPADPRLYHRNAGGAPANVAVGFAQLGGQAALMGMLGADAFGDFLHQQLAHFRVDTRRLRRTAAANTALAVVSLDPHGERGFSFYRPPSADLLFSADDVDPAAFAARPYFHFCSNSLTHEPLRSATLAALARAEAHDCLISFDVNWRPALWSEGADARAAVTALLPRAHVLKFSAEEWEWLGGADALAAHCFTGVAELLLITDGGDPIRSIDRHRAASHAAPSCKVVDSTAAGDAFVAALLNQLANQDLEAGALRARLRDPAWLAPRVAFAARCGALACTRYGAFDALPTLARYHQPD
ncbi:carbohydrate kinase family protein [Massilia glaciei]|uniref:Carbohydrate kinase n=1 Tax=Massilia glaciei TaxID=1524097 RepID=A0A2U2HF71_9BURK|nr:carbohydrate kinase [Massilia glaciei]PWF42711.1 carbohydrate kinase [Massilia glaciei]